MISSSDINHKILSNGLELLWLRMSEAPVVAVQVWYRAGSSCESENKRGIAHIVEHMMFRGSARFASEEHTRRIANIGGHCNAFTAEDAAAYINAVPAENLELLLELEADRMHGLASDKETFETERKVIVEEYHQYMNNPVGRSFLEYRSIFFDKTPYQVSPLGRIENIMSVTHEDILAYHSAHYSPANAVLAIAGDIPPDDEFLDKVAKHFASIPAGTALSTATSAFVLNKPEQNLIHRRITFDVPILLAGYAAPSASHPDTMALDVAGMVLTHGETSRLNREIVRKKQIAIMAGGTNNFLRHAGMTMFFAIHTPDVSGKKMLDALASEVEHLAGGVSEEEIDKTRLAALTSRLFDTGSAELVCQSIARAHVIDGDYSAWFRRLERLAALDAKAVADAAARWWNPQNRFVLQLEPERMNIPAYFMGLARRFIPRGAS